MRLMKREKDKSFEPCNKMGTHYFLLIFFGFLYFEVYFVFLGRGLCTLLYSDWSIGGVTVEREREAYAFQAYYYLANQHNLLSLFPLFLALPFGHGQNHVSHTANNSHLYFFFLFFSFNLSLFRSILTFVLNKN